MAGKIKQTPTASSQKTVSQPPKNNLQKLQINDPVNRNDRIMSALDKLGQKFIESEADRINMKKAVDDQFNAQKETDRKLRRNTITTEKLEKALNDAIQENERLRQIVAKSEKRQIRLQKRVERVESIASEAQSALEAKAMVLLTDRALANEVGIPQIPAYGDMDDLDSSDARRMKLATSFSGQHDYTQPQYTMPLISGLIDQPVGEQGKPWWQRRLQMTTSTILGCLVFAGLLGWAGTNLSSSPQSQMADTSIAIMQDGQLARIDLRTGEITPVMLAAKKAVQEQMSRDMQLKLPSTPAADDVAATAQDSSPAIADNAESAEGSQIETALKDEAAQTQEGKTVAEETATNTVAIVELKGELTDRIKADTALSDELKQLEAAAFAGNPEAQHDLAALYTAGQGVKQNYERASAWFKEAANANIANASYNLGVLHHQGLGVDQDMPKALNWYRKAALQGHPEAQYNLGIAYIEGVGAKYNPNMASAYFRQAALNGIVEGAYNLGLILENGLLGQAYLEQAMAWYRAAADKGSLDAAQALTALADKLGVDADQAGLLGTDKVSLAASMKDLAAIQPAAGGASSQVSLPSLNTGFDLVLANYIPLWDQIILSEIQTQLADLALYSGAQDGVIGPATVEAIKTYQTIQGLEITGKASNDLLQFMLTKAALEVDEG